VQVDIFTRDTQVNGTTYPRGSIVPPALFPEGKELQLRRSNIIRAIEFSDIGQLLAQAGSAFSVLPELAIETVSELVARAEAELSDVVAFRDAVFTHFAVDMDQTRSSEAGSDDGQPNVDDATETVDDETGPTDGEDPAGEAIASAEAARAEAEEAAKSAELVAEAVRKPLEEQSRAELEQTARSLGIEDPTQRVFPNKGILLEAVKAQISGLPAEDAVSRVGQSFPFEA